jgi:hypothetical protein
MAKTVTDETDQGLFGLQMPFGGFKEAAEAIQVCCGVAMIRDGVQFPITKAVILHNHRNDVYFFLFQGIGCCNARKRTRDPPPSIKLKPGGIGVVVKTSYESDMFGCTEVRFSASHARARPFMLQGKDSFILSPFALESGDNT